MMRHVFPLFAFCAVLSFSVSGCGRDGGVSARKGRQVPGVRDVLEAGMAGSDLNKDAGSVQEEEIPVMPAPDTKEDPPSEEKGSEGKPPVAESPSVPQAPAAGTDVDLTVLSSTMVYSEVFNMMVSPEKYIGKTIKMKGQFMSSYEEALDRHYFACIIQDATACCAQGIEFELAGNVRYPEDYPEEGGIMCVVGVFDTYEEDGCGYATLRNARLVSD